MGMVWIWEGIFVTVFGKQKHAPKMFAVSVYNPWVKPMVIHIRPLQGLLFSD